MIPDTLLSLVLFLGLIAPGLLYQLLWERRHPALEETAFREASRTALTSLLFSGLACLLVVLIRIIQPRWVMDIGQYLRDSKTYVAEHYNLIIQTVALEVLLALFIVWLFHNVPFWLAKLSRSIDPKWTRWMPEFLCPTTPLGDMRSEGIWFDVLRRKVGPGKQAWVSLRLTDGSQIRGYVSHYTPSPKPENREIALVRPKDEGGYIDITDVKLNPPERKLGPEWEYVVVRGDEITYMNVTYLDL